MHGLEKLNAINEMISGAGTVKPYLDKYFNLYAFIKGREPGPALAITAHHDVVNKKSENCLDNNASLLNLVSLHNQIIDNCLQGRLPKRDVVIAWVDMEEACNPALAGVNQLLRDYPIEYLLDLELTAGGSHPVISRHGTFKLLPDIIEVGMPPNNAVLAITARAQGATLRGTACLTLVSDKDLLEIKIRGRCERWFQCHRETDSFSRWFSVVESEALVNLLLKLLD